MKRKALKKSKRIRCYRVADIHFDYRVRERKLRAVRIRSRGIGGESGG